MTDNKNVPKIIENSGLALHKTRNLLSITEKILASKTPVILDRFELLDKLSKVTRAAFDLGHIEFKENSRFVLESVREKFGYSVANSIDIDALLACYIGIRRGYVGATNVKELGKYNSIQDLYENTKEREILLLVLDVMETAFKLGHMDFKENAKFVVDSIRKQSFETASLIKINDLRCGYISQFGGVEGTTPFLELAQYNSIEDLYT